MGESEGGMIGSPQAQQRYKSLRYPRGYRRWLQKSILHYLMCYVYYINFNTICKSAIRQIFEVQNI